MCVLRTHTCIHTHTHTFCYDLFFAACAETYIHIHKQMYVLRTHTYIHTQHTCTKSAIISSWGDMLVKINTHTLTHTYRCMCYVHRRAYIHNIHTTHMHRFCYNIFLGGHARQNNWKKVSICVYWMFFFVLNVFACIYLCQNALKMLEYACSLCVWMYLFIIKITAKRWEHGHHHAYVHTCVCTGIMHMYMCVCVYTYIMHMCIRVCVRTSCICVYMCVHVHHAYVHTRHNVHIHTLEHIYIIQFMKVLKTMERDMQSCTHTCMHAYIHTYIHALCCSPWRCSKPWSEKEYKPTFILTHTSSGM